MSRGVAEVARYLGGSWRYDGGATTTQKAGRILDARGVHGDDGFLVPIQSARHLLLRLLTVFFVPSPVSRSGATAALGFYALLLRAICAVWMLLVQPACGESGSDEPINSINICIESA